MNSKQRRKIKRQQQFKSKQTQTKTQTSTKKPAQTETLTSLFAKLNFNLLNKQIIKNKTLKLKNQLLELQKQNQNKLNPTQNDTAIFFF
jgi:hypothetical protein